MRVVKIGGAALVRFEEVWASDGLSSSLRSPDTVVVHGGSRHVDELSRKLGVKVERLTSPSGVTFRRTTREVLDVYLAAMMRANRELVGFLQARGINAVGVMGIEHELVIGRRKKLVKALINGKIVAIRDDYSGTVEKINVGALMELRKLGLPVIASVAYDPVENVPLNVDGDKVAYHMALTTNARELVFVSDSAFMADGSVVERLNLNELPELLGYAKGGMRKKLMMAAKAVESGVERVVIQGLNGRTVIT